MQTSTTIPLPISCERVPILRRNDRQTTADDSVKFLQRRLNGCGFRLTIDGFFGPKTEAAVRSFQARRKITNPAFLVDGIVGPQTWQALDACIIIATC